MESIKIAVDVDTSAVKEATEALNELAAAAERAKATLDALLDKGVVVSTSSCPTPPEDRMIDRKSPTTRRWVG